MSSRTLPLVLLALALGVAGFTLWWALRVDDDPGRLDDQKTQAASASDEEAARRDAGQGNVVRPPDVDPAVAPPAVENPIVPAVDPRLADVLEVVYTDRSGPAAGVTVELLSPTEYRALTVDDPSHFLRRDTLEPRAGRRLVTDESGRIVFDRHRPRVVSLRATTATHHGEIYLSDEEKSDPTRPLRLRLKRCFQIPVRVLTAEGEPAAGVEVGLTRPIGQRPSRRRPTVSCARRTDDAGRVRLRIPIGIPDSRTTIPIDVVALGIFRELPRYTVTLGPETIEEVTLTLPPAGSVTVTVEPPAGITLPAARRTFALERQVAPNDAAPRGAPFVMEIQADPAAGKARFHPVGLGLDLRARLRPRRDDAFGEAESIGPGPTRRDETADLALRIENDASVLRGRLIDETGAPLANTSFRLASLVTGDGSMASGPLGEARTDAKGRFQVRVKPDTRHHGDWATGTSARRTIIFDLRDAEVPRVAELEIPLLLNPGPREVGDVTVALPPLIAGGQIVGADPGAFDARDLQLGYREADRSWNSDASFIVRSMQLSPVSLDNRFEIRGFIDAAHRNTEFRLTPLPGPYTGEALTFAAGTADLELRVRPLARLRGRFLLPEGAKDQGLIAAAATDEQIADDELPEGERFPVARVASDGSFDIRGAPTGTVRFGLITEQRGEYPQVIRTLELREGQSRDLGVIDLRETLLKFVVRVRDRDGAVPPRADFWIVEDTEETAFWRKGIWNDQDLVFFDLRDEVPGGIRSKGLRTQALRLHPGLNEVILAPTIDVDLRVDLPELPPNGHLRTRLLLIPVDRKGSAVGTSPHRDGRHHRAALHAPGRYRITYRINFRGRPRLEADLGVHEIADGPGQVIDAAFTPKDLEAIETLRKELVEDG